MTHFLLYSQKTPFGNFKGFGGTNTVVAEKPNFTFIVGKNPGDPKTSTPSKTNGNAPPKAGDKLTSVEYFHQLKSLNVSVSAWIAKHVQTNPYCILTPVFRDYEKHLAKIESNRPQQLDSESSGIFKFINYVPTNLEFTLR